jgi:hypothetical protein
MMPLTASGDWSIFRPTDVHWRLDVCPKTWTCPLPPGCPRRRAGFTLIEVVLTIGLSAVLLMGLWSLFGVYNRLFERAHTQAGQSQIVRGLLRQMTEDLHSAIQDTAEAPPGTVGPVRRFGLFGSSRSLQIDVIQAARPRISTAAASAAGDSSDRPTAGQALELRTIRYTFKQPADTATDATADAATDTESSSSSERPGLTRRELDFETPQEPAGQQAAPQAENTEEEVYEDEPPTELSALDLLGPNPNDDSITWIPEVVSLEFRYFDGIEWSSTWNSLQRGSLPVAVEVLIQVDSAGDELPEPREVAATDDETPPEDAETTSDAAPAPARGVSHRFLIELPSAVLHQELARARQQQQTEAEAMPDVEAVAAEGAAEPEEEVTEAPAASVVPAADPAAVSTLVPADAPLAAPVAAAPPDLPAVAQPVPPETAEPAAPAPPRAPRRPRRSKKPAADEETPAPVNELPPDQWMRAIPR